MAVVEINEESPLRNEVRRLIAEADAWSRALYPPGSRHPVTAEALAVDGTRFFVARADGVAVGCAALLRDDGAGELKRMFVLDRARGMGVGRAILKAVEAAAASAGMASIRMETGVHNYDALGLYRRAGYADRGPFGPYAADELSVFLEKPLG